MAAPTTFFYVYTPCCGADPIFFKAGPSGIVPGTYNKVFIYEGAVNGPGYGGLYIGQCYSVTIAELGTLPPPAPQNSTQYSFLDVVPSPGISNLLPINLDNPSCIGQECPPCPQVCYLLISCDFTTVPFTTTTDLSAYVGQSIQISTPDIGTICVQVQIAPPTVTCNNSIPVVYVGTCVCDCICYSIIATSKDCVYINCDGELVQTGFLNGSEIQICSKTYPYFPGIDIQKPFYVIDNGLCIDGQCSVLCYKLQDCEGKLADIYTTKVSLGTYAILGQIVTLLEYPGVCWEVIDTAICDCAIDVIVIESFDDCLTCLGTPKYKLTNCDTPTTIVYTTSDLGAYVNQVIIRLDCPGCWLVEEVDLIPSDVVIVVDATYIDCIECARIYYLLEDCSGLLPDAITYTDLSTYVGSIIKLEYCPETCWSVSITLNATNAGEVVIIDQEYLNCNTCLDTLPCICITVRNDDESTVSNTYRYLDCDHVLQNFTLLFGETSEKFCIVAWQFYHPDTDYIEAFGNCTQATVQDPWTCPPPIYPRRFIRPGYYVPACSIDKFEKITCKAAEAMYKKVLEQRYGISNCCPDDDNKWLIKKELIDLAGLVDPAYTCTPVQSCCNEAPNCGCTPLKTCNS